MASNLLYEHDVLLYDFKTRQRKIAEMKKSDDKETLQTAHELSLYNDGIDRAFSQVFGYSLYAEDEDYLTSEYKRRKLNETNS